MLNSEEPETAHKLNLEHADRCQDVHKVRRMSKMFTFSVREKTGGRQETCSSIFFEFIIFLSDNI
jgi:hypothetical protein